MNPTSGYLYLTSGYLYPMSGYLYPTSDIQYLTSDKNWARAVGLGQGYPTSEIYRTSDIDIGHRI